jgi:hypothetical protein
MSLTTTPATRVLVVADWTVDPHAIVAAASARRHEGACTFALRIPAWLHGVDWAGDPSASRPCAERQLASAVALFQAAGLSLEAAAVGDPDPIAATEDALADWPADELLLCVRERRLSPVRVFDLAHRARRATGLPVRRAGLRRERRGHCAADRG